jgi:hypothetical protein
MATFLALAHTIHASPLFTESTFVQPAWLYPPLCILQILTPASRDIDPIKLLLGQILGFICLLQSGPQEGSC